MNILFRNLIVVYAVLFCFPLTAYSAENLFIAAETPSAFDQALSRTPSAVSRYRVVEVQVGSLGSVYNPVEKLQLNLFDDTIFTATLKRVEPTRRGFSWIGTIDGVAYSDVVLVNNGGVVMGSVSMPGGNYAIRFQEGALHTIEELDTSNFPQELEPISAPEQPAAIAPDTVEVSGDDGCGEITVLVAYTPEARAAAGGVAAMETLIDTAIAETNSSYANSNMMQRINLVNTMETAPGDAANAFEADLYNLQDTTDGIFDEVDAAREVYHADLVHLIIENYDSCGLGFLNASASWAFSVSHRTCATGYYSFGHELGHNMGARHDWYVDDTVSSAKAYLNLDNRWRTVMAYNKLCMDTGQTCIRIQYWSNPDKTYGSPAAAMGVPSGTATDCVEYSLNPDPLSCDADNRSTLNSTCDTVADFRLSPTGPDLIVQSPNVNTSTLATLESYTFSATVSNIGASSSAATTLRYYLSIDATITAGDIEQGTDSVGSLASSDNTATSMSLTAPTTPGTYYVGSCVDQFLGELNISNNCSSAVEITVMDEGPSLTSPSFKWNLFLPAFIGHDQK